MKKVLTILCLCLLAAISLVVYARQTGEFARSGRFRAMLAELQACGANLSGVDEEARSIQNVDLSSARVDYSQIDGIFSDFSAWKVQTLVLPKSFPEKSAQALERDFPQIELVVQKEQNER